MVARWLHEICEYPAMKRKPRTPIPSDIAAKILFASDRTCCVCRSEGKPVQIHHIDDDPKNHLGGNLAVLCFDCHTETQTSGGFHRKLDADQVILYRDDWYRIVARNRAEAEVSAVLDQAHRSNELACITTRLEMYRAREEYWLLAIEYQSIGNAELRDKYIELSLQQYPKDRDLLITFRALQGRISEVPREVINEQITYLESTKQWSQLGRLYERISDYKNAAINYCKSVIKDLETGHPHPAAFYLRELHKKSIDTRLFEVAYRQATATGNMRGMIRALEELGWTDELVDVLLRNRSEIERLADPHLLVMLYHATGEVAKADEQRNKLFTQRRS